MSRIAYQLHRLEEASLISPVVPEPDLEYLFRHVLLQDAAYGSLLKGDRKRLHLAVGETLEQLYPERLSELAPLIGAHFHEAGAIDKARHYFVLAGDNALSLYANQEAEYYHRLALSLTGDDAGRAVLLAGLGEALLRQSSYNEAVSTWRLAISFYMEAANWGEVARLYSCAARAVWWTGDAPAGLELCREGLAAVHTGIADQAQEETAGMAALLHETARAYLLNGQPQRAPVLCRKALALAELLNLPEIWVEGQTTMALLLRRERRFAEAKAAMDEAIAQADRHHLLLAGARAHYSLAEILEGDLADLAGAQQHYEQAAGLVRRRHSTVEELYCLAAVANVSLQLADFARVDSLLTQMRRLAGTGRRGMARFLLQLTSARLAYYRSATASACAGLAACLAEIRAIGDSGYLVTTLIALVESLLMAGEGEAAASPAAEAVALTKPAGGIPAVIALCLLSRVQIAQQRPEQAAESMTAAVLLAGLPPPPAAIEHLTLAEARLAQAEGRHAAARIAYTAAAAIQEQLGKTWYRQRTLEEMGGLG